MKIVAVRIGNRYGPEYETYLESKLPEYEFVWIREPMADNIKLQWNKMYGMTLDINQPICVIDIDILLINDYKKIFEYPVKQGQFLAAPGWWRDLKGEEGKRFSINGGFYKYYPKDCKYIYEKFMNNPEHWQKKYIEEGFTSGPINGEQHFIEDSVKEKLELIKLPNEWFCRMEARNKHFARHTLATLNRLYKEVTGNPYMFLGNEFHPDIKYVHFTHMDNHPHEWEKYNLFV
jgi:hypothetical protein